MEKEKLVKIIDAADIICDECWGVEEDCHNCKVRLICDYAREQYNKTKEETVCPTNPKP